MERQYQATTLQHINYGYDNTSQLTSALSTETPTALENFTYSYDAMGNHNQWKKGGGSTVTGGITKTYTNNNLN